MKKQWKKTGRGIVLLVVMLACVMWGRTPAGAAVADIQVTNGGTVEVSVNVGDTGRFQPVTDSLTDEQGQPLLIARWSYYSHDQEDYAADEVLRIDQEGNYEALSYGRVAVSIYGYAENGTTVFTGYCRITVGIDMTDVTLVTDQLSGYVTGADSFTGKIKINSPFKLNEDNSILTYNSDRSDMMISCQLADNELWISTYSDGSATLTVTINGKDFVIRIKVERLEISKASILAAKGTKTTLKVKGTKDKAVWTSTNTRVAKVSRDGTVRCRKAGNAVITARLGNVRVGCAVSVVSAKMLKVVRTAKKIGKNWKYSQPRRMQTGYYDCSSLVWKAYKKAGQTFGNRYYAPVAADLGKWCAGRKKMIIKSCKWSDVQKMKLRPGDLLFKPGENNGRYRGIYHVEMFVGYTLSYYDESGKPVVSELWAARSEGYSSGGFPIGRP